MPSSDIDDDFNQATAAAQLLTGGDSKETEKGNVAESQIPVVSAF